VENKNNNPVNIRFVDKTSDIRNLSENTTSDVMTIHTHTASVRHGDAIASASIGHGDAIDAIASPTLKNWPLFRQNFQHFGKVYSFIHM